MRRRTRSPGPGEPAEGELLSQIASWTRLVPISEILVDEDFKDARLYEDPLHPEWYATEGQNVADLAESMAAEGLKVPIVVLATRRKGKDVLLLRAGGRRRKAAMRLGWKEIPAIVLPDDMPEEMQHWYNILENCARKNLTTYELAVSAKHMRDAFNVKATDFARKTGFSPSYVGNLMGCLDRLPEELIEQWRGGARVSLDQWINISYLDREDALRAFGRLVGASPRSRMNGTGRGRKRSLPPPRWLSRMQRLYVGVEGSDLPPRARDLVLKTIEVCMGGADSIPGVYEPGRQRKYEAKARLRRELALPPPAEEGREMPMSREEMPE